MISSKVFFLSEDYVLHHTNFESCSFMLFNIKTGRIYRLNNVSFSMLKAFDGHRTCEQILYDLHARYDIDFQCISADFSHLLDIWVNKGILVERRCF